VILGKLKNLFRGKGVSSNRQLKEYRKVVELVRKLLHEGYIPVSPVDDNEQCVMELIGRYYDDPREFVRVVIPPEPGDVIYFAKVNSRLRKALASLYSDNIIAIDVYTTVEGCTAKILEAKDPAQRAKFIEGFPKYIESEIMGRGLEEENKG
jgi:hypothetical protein